MIGYFLNLKYKIVITSKILINKISKKTLSVKKFEMIDDGKTLIYFNNNDTGENYIRDVEWVFLNKKILRGFNNKEAAKIGSMYAKYIFKLKNE